MSITETGEEFRQRSLAHMLRSLGQIANQALYTPQRNRREKR